VQEIVKPTAFQWDSSRHLKMIIGHDIVTR
jgi:hypothetical protein